VPSSRLTLRNRSSLVKSALLVDGEDAGRRSVRRHLELRGWLVLEAASGEIALDLVIADKVQVDAVVVDMGLLGLSGSALCARIKALRPTLADRIIVASSDAYGAMQALEREQLECPILAKPFELDDLDQLLDVIVTTS